MKEIINMTPHGLNPFRTGQCLSTLVAEKYATGSDGLNPFRTGQCLSTAEGDFSFIFQYVTNRLPKLLQGLKS